VRRAARAALLALLACSADAARVAAGPAPALQARTIAVERAGVVRVALPASAFAASDGFSVLGPDGAAVRWRLLALDARGSQHLARVVSVEESATGWTLLLDAGPSPPAHQGVRLPLAAGGLAKVTLSTSDDGKTFTAIGDATLFRLGKADELQATSLAYPATSARYLRVDWPHAAGFPRLAEARLDTVSTAAEELALPASACTRAGAHETACDLGAVGDRPIVTLLVALPRAAGAVGWRLRTAREGAWELAGEGAWSDAPLDAPGAPAAGAPRPIAVGATHGRGLRLELWGASGAPQPQQLDARVLPLALEIEAPAAGSYEIRSGAGLPRPGAESAGGDEQAQWLTPGAAHAAPPPPPLVTAAGGPLPRTRFARRWQVHALAAPGDVVRLPLSPEVESAAREDLGDLRLARDEHQVPYLVDVAGEPERVEAWDGLTLATGRHGASSVELALPAVRDGELLLRAPPQAIHRMVRIVEPRASEGLAAPAIDLPWSEWRCEPLPPLPCEVALPIGQRAAGRVRIEIDDGDNAPLAGVSAELWRAHRELLFPWPGGDVALLAGSSEVGTPTYELAAAADSLRARPARPAQLTAEPIAADRWPRWAPVASLALAAAVLLVLLARALPKPAA